MLKYYFDYVRSWLEREEGQDLIEYALLVIFIALIAMITIPAVGNALSGTFSIIGSKVTYTGP